MAGGSRLERLNHSRGLAMKLKLPATLFAALLLAGCFDSSDADKSSESSQEKASIQMQQKDDAEQ